MGHPGRWAFIYGVIRRALEVFSSIEHVVNENARVMSKLEKLGGGGVMCISNPSYLLTKASRD